MIKALINQVDCPYRSLTGFQNRLPVDKNVSKITKFTLWEMKLWWNQQKCTGSLVALVYVQNTMPQPVTVQEQMPFKQKLSDDLTVPQLQWFLLYIRPIYGTKDAGKVQSCTTLFYGYILYTVQNKKFLSFITM